LGPTTHECVEVLTRVGPRLFPAVASVTRVQPLAISRVHTHEERRAVNRDLKSQNALIALARTRRMQRALAHAYIHRDAPLPTLRLSLGYMTSTACTTDEVSGLGHHMTLLGVARAEGVAYVVEELGPSEAPIIYRLWMRRPRAGHLVPSHAWYEQGDDPREIRARIASIATTLEAAVPTTTEAWMLSTRVVQRRALRVASHESPIRKFALQLR